MRKYHRWAPWGTQPSRTCFNDWNLDFWYYRELYRMVRTIRKYCMDLGPSLGRCGVQDSSLPQAPPFFLHSPYHRASEHHCDHDCCAAFRIQGVTKYIAGPEISKFRLQRRSAPPRPWKSAVTSKCTPHISGNISTNTSRIDTRSSWGLRAVLYTATRPMQMVLVGPTAAKKFARCHIPYRRFFLFLPALQTIGSA